MGVKLFGRGMEEVLRWVEEGLRQENKGNLWIATVNPEFLMTAEKDKIFSRIIRQETDLNVPDGVGLAWAGEVGKEGGENWQRRLVVGLGAGIKVLRGGLRERVVPGCELMERMIGVAAKNGWRVFLLGGWGNRAEKAARNFQLSIPNFQKKGWIKSCPGEPEVSNKEVVERIKKFKPKMLFVAYGMGKQEKWISANLDRFEGLVAMGVGRSFDYFSGELARAPEGWRRLGLEWLYSLIKEPKRWRRQLSLPRFVWRVIKNQV